MQHAGSVAWLLQYGLARCANCSQELHFRAHVHLNPTGRTCNARLVAFDMFGLRQE